METALIAPTFCQEGDVFWRLHENGLSVEFEFRDEDGEFEIRGFHKWDGCTNWETSEACMFHCCEPSDFRRLMHKFDVVAVIAAREIPDYCGTIPLLTPQD